MPAPGFRRAEYGVRLPHSSLSPSAIIVGCVRPDFASDRDGPCCLTLFDLSKQLAIFLRMKYLVSRQGRELGSFDFHELAPLLRTGVLHPSDFFWFNGMEHWRRLGDLVPDSFGQVPGRDGSDLPSHEPYPGPDHGPEGGVVGCPNCQSTRVTKASAIYERGTKVTSYEGVSSRGIPYGRTSESSTTLARRCAPPEKPNRPTTGHFAGLVTLSSVAAAILLAAMGVWLSFTVGFEHGAKFLFCCLLCLVLAYFSGRKWKREDLRDGAEYQLLLADYGRDMADYDWTWHCGKCGNLFKVN